MVLQNVIIIKHIKALRCAYAWLETYRVGGSVSLFTVHILFFFLYNNYIIYVISIQVFEALVYSLYCILYMVY